MNIAIIVIQAVIFIVAVILGLRYYTHMLQLSSYQFQGYFRFLKSVAVKYGIIHLCVFGLLVLNGFGSEVLLNTVSGISEIRPALLLRAIGEALVLLAFVIAYKPGEAKKKFVVTDRVKDSLSLMVFSLR